MFTGIVQGVATVARITDRPGLRSFRLRFPPGFAQDLAIGASVSCDGVCLTVTALHGDDGADFDVMLQSLNLTTLASLVEGSRLNVERAARDGAEIGGHPLSGHVDFTATVAAVRQPQNNHVIRVAVPAPWRRYVFAKGYIALNGASLTVAEVNKAEGWFEVWLIPETLRMTTFGDKTPGTAINIEMPAFGLGLGWLLSIIAASTTARIIGAEQRRFAQGALGKYLPRDVAQQILREPGAVATAWRAPRNLCAVHRYRRLHQPVPDARSGNRRDDAQRISRGDVRHHPQIWRHHRQVRRRCRGGVLGRAAGPAR